MDQSWGWTSTLAATTRYEERLADSAYHRRLAELPRAPRPHRRRLLRRSDDARLPVSLHRLIDLIRSGTTDVLRRPPRRRTTHPAEHQDLGEHTRTRGSTVELNVALPHEMLVQEHQQTLMAQAEDARRRRALRDVTRQEHRAPIAALLRLVRLADGAERRWRVAGHQETTRTRTVPPCTSRTARSWLA